MSGQRSPATRMTAAWRWLGHAGAAMAGLLAAGALGALLVDQWVARPQVEAVHRMVEAAAASERQPPAALADLVDRVHGDRLAGLLARRAVAEAPPRGSLARVSREIIVALALPWHLTRGELRGAFLASSVMGPDLQGFEAASRRTLGVPLGRVDAAQAARLMAMAWAPATAAQNPERFERQVARLQSLAPSMPAR